MLTVLEKLPGMLFRRPSNALGSLNYMEECFPALSFHFSHCRSVPDTWFLFLLFSGSFSLQREMWGCKACLAQVALVRAIYWVWLKGRWRSRRIQRRKRDPIPRAKSFHLQCSAACDVDFSLGFVSVMWYNSISCLPHPAPHNLTTWMETGRGESSLFWWIFSDTSLLQCMSVNLCITQRCLCSSLHHSRFVSLWEGFLQCWLVWGDANFFLCNLFKVLLNFFYPMYLPAAQELLILICRRIWGKLRKEKIFICRKTKQHPVKPEGESKSILYTYSK